MRERLSLYAFVALGSAGGAVLRWGMSAGMMAFAGAGFPWGTLIVNVTGSAAIGFYARFSSADGRAPASAHLRHLVMTGVLGGYTTFSVFSLEALRQIQRAEWAAAGIYVAVSLLTWLGAVWFGDALAARLNRASKA